LRKKVVITGANGFLGSWVARRLVGDYDLIAVVRPNSNTYRISDLQDLLLIRLDESKWGELIESVKPDAVLLFDWSGVENGEHNSFIQRENLKRWQEVALAAQSAGTSIFIGVGSQAEVGPRNEAIPEDAADNPLTEYGLVKVQTRQVLQELLLGSGTRFLWLRVFSTYGPMDSPKWLIPSLIDAFNAEKNLPMTSGEQQWSFLHSLDLAHAVRMLMNESSLEGVVNVGNETLASVRDVALQIAFLMDKPTSPNFGEVSYRDHQVMLLKPQCLKLTSIGWKPLVPLEAGLIQTIEWFSRKKLQSMTLENGQRFNDSLPPRP
jgi:UDP-glucose 4-epimerase